MNIEQIRHMVDTLVSEGNTNSKGGPCCGAIAEWLAVRFGWQEYYAPVYDSQGQMITDDHAWAILPDGTICDASITQFAGILPAWPGTHDIAIIPKDHPYQKHYHRYS